MRIRAAVLLAVLLAVVGCSSTGTGSQLAAAEPTATSSAAPPSITTATNPSCPDFLVSTFLGQKAAAADSITSRGWRVDFSSADVATGSIKLDSTLATIIGVDKDPVGCMATFKVKVDAPATPTAPVIPAGPLTTVSDGTYLVGTDMEAGSYKTSGGEGCYWARLKDDAGSKIIANNLSDGPARFTAKKGEYVQISRCTFTKV